MNSKKQELKEEIKYLKKKFNRLVKSKDYSHKGLTSVKITADKIIKLRKKLK